MSLQLNISPNLKSFSAYGEGYVAVNQERFSQPVVVTPSQVFTDWPAQKFTTLSPADFDYLLALRPEVIIFGTGIQQQFADPALYHHLLAARVSVEFMDTPAACRTYNILADEGRNVLAAILL